MGGPKGRSPSILHDERPSLSNNGHLTMKICHSHNLNYDPDVDKPYGIRVSLPPGDSFRALVDTSWEQFHWFATEHDRDRALEDMASEHIYSRRGDRPTVVFDRVERTPT